MLNDGNIIRFSYFPDEQYPIFHLRISFFVMPLCLRYFKAGFAVIGKLLLASDINSFGIYGTPNCGKGEPNQVIRVGHASPACLFEKIQVFGGA